jgi:GT2 family glycosyltransferase
VEAVGRTALARLIAVATMSRFGVGNSPFRTVRGRTMLVDTANFPAYPRSVLNRIGQFDEETGCDEDDDYNHRLRASGGTVLLAADVRSRVYCRNSLSALSRQFFRYGFFKVRVLQKHPRQMSARHFVPPFFVASVLIALVTSFTSAGKAALLLIAAAYLAATVFASVMATPRAGLGALALPLVFAVLHFSYGIGFLAGLVHFRRRWGDHAEGGRRG